MSLPSDHSISPSSFKNILRKPQRDGGEIFGSLNEAEDGNPSVGKERIETLAQRPGIVKTRNQLMDAAYNDDVFVDDRTIDSHIKRLRKKFRAVDHQFKAIETLYGVGYRFNEE